jgi:hypothetical protein
VFEDPVLSKCTSTTMKAESRVLTRFHMTQTPEAVKRKPFARGNPLNNPYTIFHHALKNREPVIGLVPFLKSGHLYQVPVPPADGHCWVLAMSE